MTSPVLTRKLRSTGVDAVARRLLIQPPGGGIREGAGSEEVEEMMAWFRCFFRNHHNPVRHPLGGFKCADCGEAGADLDQMGFVGGGYVLPVRRVFSRDRGEFTRTMSWEPSVKGW